jgi:membrane protease YdiL (CAAX protease family)
MKDHPTLASIEPRSDRVAPTQVEIPQYRRRSILAIWAAAALPMGALAWVIAPWFSSGRGETSLIRPLLLLLTAGLAWQFILVIGLVWLEQRDLRWSTLRSALWLNSPRSPRTGQTGGKVWLAVPVLIAAFGAEQLIPNLPHPAARDLGEVLGSDAGHAFFHGAWGWFAVVVMLGIFNTVLGEELLFRGFLLPRMNGAFGRADWVANGLLFAAYHLHVPWVIPATLVDMLVVAYPTKRYRSAWIGITVHSAQTVFITVAVLALVL